jgi:cysteine-rich repeat protein
MKALRSLFFPALPLAALMSLAPAPSVALTVTPGTILHQEDLGGLRYRKFNDPAGFEAFIGIDPNSAAIRAGADVAWDLANPNQIVFEYDSGLDVLTTTITNTRPGSPFVITYPSYVANLVPPNVSGDFGIGDLNLMQITLRLQDVTAPPSTITFQNVTLDGDPVGTFSAVEGGFAHWTITGVDLGSGFVLAGDLLLGGPFSGCDECSSVQILVGHVNECGNGVIEPGGDNGPAEDCEDGNTANGDCCSAACEYDPIETPCLDADVCNGAETCDGFGACVDKPDLDCDDGVACTTDTCDTLDGCEHAPVNSACDDGVLCTQDVCDDQLGCVSLGDLHQMCLDADRSSVQIRATAGGAKDRLKWKWTRGEATTLDDLGDPLTTDTYALCIYDSSAGVPNLVTTLEVPPSGAWKPSGTKGWKYKDKSGAADGLQKAKISTGAAGRSKASLKAGGVNLPTPPPASPTALFSADPGVTVQLVNSAGTCWTTTFTSTKKNDVDNYKAKAN